jgi:hypothetical protein
MVSFVQSKSAHSLSGNTVSATFTANVARGNGLIAAVTWIDPNNNATPYPSIDVADTAHGAFNPQAQAHAGLGGDILTQAFFIPFSKIGPNGAVVATASAPGIMFISIHEVAPDAGQIFVADVSGINWGIGWTSQFSFPFGTLIRTFGVARNADAYALLVFATRTGNINPTCPGMTSREYEAKTTAVGSLAVLGSQATFDEFGNFFGSYAQDNPVWSFPSSIVNALLITFASIPAIADAPTGLAASYMVNEYPTDQTITLAQDQGFDIHYTTDGTTPTSASPLYTVPFTVTGTMTVKAIAIQPAVSVWPTAFWADSPIVSATYDIFTGTCANPGNIIDGNDSTFATLTCLGSAGDVIAVRVDTLHGITGGVGGIVVDFEVTQNDLVAPSQTLPAWKVSAFVGSTETVMASAAPGAGVLARQTIAHPVLAGVDALTFAAKIAAICQIPGSTGGVQLKVYAAYLEEPSPAGPGFGEYFGTFGS